jgi:hypothetical protein
MLYRTLNKPHAITSDLLTMRTLALARTLTCLAPGCVTAPVIAQQENNVHLELSSKFNLSLGVYYPQREYELSVDGSLGEIADPIDFDAALDRDEQDPLLTGLFAGNSKKSGH